MLKFEDLAPAPTGFVPAGVAKGPAEPTASDAPPNFRRVSVDDKKVINSKAGALNAVPSDGGMAASGAASTTESTEEPKFCSIDNPECEACQ